MAVQKPSLISLNDANSSRRTSTGGFNERDRSRLIVVGMLDMKTSRDPLTEIVTHGLGSCIAVVARDPVSLVGGMLHFQLPSSDHDLERAQRCPFMFADTGIPELVKEVCSQGGHQDRLTVKLFGGASIFDRGGVFNIGKRNYMAAKKVLSRLDCFVSAEDVGGEVWRTISLNVGTGTVAVTNGTIMYSV